MIATAAIRAQVEELVYQSALFLDARDFDGYLGLCDPDYRYVITTHSPEIRQEMVWLDHDREGLKTLLETLPRHNSDHSPLSRHVTVYTIDVDAAQASAVVTSALQVFRTALDGGATELFAVGKIRDRVRLSDAGARLAARQIKLDTRMLGIGTHIPF